MEKHRLFFARAQLTWTGTFAVAWQVALIITAGTQASGTVIHRNLLSGLMVTSLVISSICFWWNSLYWGPTAGTRKGLGWNEVCRRVVGETDVSYEKRLSRLVRCYGDQMVHGWIVASSAYVLIFLLNFYWHQGIFDFLLLPGYSLQDLLNFYTMQEFYRAQMGIGAIAVALALVTVLADMFKRFVLAMGEAAAVQVADGTTATGNLPSPSMYNQASTLTGAVYIKS